MFIVLWGLWRRFVEIPAVRYLTDLFNRFGNNNGYFYAAGLSFFLLLSFAPVVLSGVAILSCLYSTHIASLKVTEFVENALPAGAARQEAAKFLLQRFHLHDQLRGLVHQRGIAGIVGLLSLFWAAIQIFLNSSTAMNVMWGVRETRNWFLLRFGALGLMLFTGLVFALSFFLSSAPTAIENYHLAIFKQWPYSMGVLSFVFELIALLLNAGMYIVMYKLLPNANVGWPAATIGGVSASVLFEIAKKLIAVYLLRPNNTIYGSLADLIIFVLWIYYSMMILLLGGEVAASVARMRLHPKPKIVVRARKT